VILFNKKMVDGEPKKTKHTYVIRASCVWLIVLPTALQEAYGTRNSSCMIHDRGRSVCHADLLLEALNRCINVVH